MNGVNYAGFLTAESGLGSAARGMVHTLENMGIPCSLLDVSCTPSRRCDDSLQSRITSTAPYDTSILHVNPDVATKAIQELPDAFWNVDKRIAYWVWEVPDVPQKWVRLSKQFQEIWTPSSFCADILSKALPVPVRTVPHAVIVEENAPRMHADTPTFVVLFDYLSIFERKNPLGAIAAFKQAFPKNEQVKLCVKCINSAAYPKEHTTLLDAIAADDRIALLDAYMTSSETHELIRNATAVVSLHRSEGFGLHLAEALAMGTPVVATNYGGNTDFMTSKQSYPIAYTLTKLQKSYGPYKRSAVWAEPDITQAAECLRTIAAAHLATAEHSYAA